MSEIKESAAELIELVCNLMEKIKSGAITFEQLRWFNELDESERARLTGGKSKDKKFGNPATFDITVPEDWKPNVALEVLNEEFEEKKYYFNSNITDKRFKASALRPGEKARIHVCQIKYRVSSDNCLDFIKSQGGFCLGAKDAALIWQIAKNNLPNQKWLIFINKKDNLWVGSDGWVRVPVLARYGGGDWDFHLSDFVHAWNPGYCLVFASAA